MSEDHHKDNEGPDEEEMNKIKKRKDQSSFVQSLDDYEVMVWVSLQFLDIHYAFKNCDEEQSSHD